jgi:hypothetical protein
VARRGGAAPGRHVVGTAAELAAWARAGGPGDVFRPSLLDDPAVTVIGRTVDGDVLAGAVLNRSGDVVGISNVFGDDLAGCLGLAGTLVPGAVLVGYQSGDALTDARAQVHGDRPAPRLAAARVTGVGGSPGSATERMPPPSRVP